VIIVNKIIWVGAERFWCSYGMWVFWESGSGCTLASIDKANENWCLMIRSMWKLRKRWESMAQYIRFWLKTKQRC